MSHQVFSKRARARARPPSPPPIPLPFFPNGYARAGRVYAFMRSPETRSREIYVRGRLREGDRAGPRQ